MQIRTLTIAAILAASLGLGACSGDDYGKTVEQGRAVAFGNGQVTFVKDSNVDPKKYPMYENSIRTYKLPADPKEIGPAPEVGNLIDVDVAKKEIKVYRNNALETMSVEIVNEQKGVESHNAAVKGKKFPMVNKDKGEVTVYMKKTLATFKIPSSLASTDEAFWMIGDNVRVFTKEEGVARRFMNITKTNIFKK